jgi:predicted amidohydrolase YtcJ
MPKIACVIFFLLIALFSFACQQKTEAEVMYVNGRIYTGLPSADTVEVVLTAGDTIIYAGSHLGAEPLLNEKTRIVDLAGAFMYPGFIEGHAHLMGIGYQQLSLNLAGANSYAEIVAMVADAVAKTPPGTWIRGRGWHQSKWQPQARPLVAGFPTHTQLSQISPEHPVFLTHASGHAILVNARAMAIAGISDETPDPEGGEIIRDRRGRATGVFNETAEELIRRHVPDYSEAQQDRALTNAIDHCLSHGLTAFHDAGAGRETIRRYRRFAAAGKLGLRLYVMLDGDSTQLVQEYFERGPLIDAHNGMLTVRSIKLYADGALGSRGAWLLAPYSDRPQSMGLAVTPMRQLRAIASSALPAGFQICTHAIGDRANREVLDLYGDIAAGMAMQQTPRWRIEHAQHLHPDDIHRFAELGVIAAMQSVHMASDMPWAIDRLGGGRIASGAYMWQSLKQAGAIIINGSDAPVEAVSPLVSFYAAVARKTLTGKSEAWFHPEQALSRDQALATYTIEAAYAAFQEDRKGTIEAGKWADFTILDRDIMRCREAEILKTRVLATIVAGDEVYRLNE